MYVCPLGLQSVSVSLMSKLGGQFTIFVTSSNKMKKGYEKNYFIPSCNALNLVKKDFKLCDPFLWIRFSRLKVAGPSKII